ncbi:hypothetical protein [Pseudomonas sp. N040]|uniref:hypothetical protein n=1 Tax=Pseudomonas sp. N040 TaxID=2785325 RepID=UPI0018A2DFE2|nr:hypothetical protein [Pseudomonas sp. N040]MBF7731104.1 hypothetical protein [Pseudomonas sp. N040]MBW7014747.1 hypothetical protein [Pseudomonas sp. N040]
MLFDLLEHPDSNAKVPLYEGTFFISSMDKLFQVINLTGGVKHLYEKTRPAGTLTWKTLYKLSSSDCSKDMLRPTTITKLERLFAGNPSAISSITTVMAKGAHWPEHSQWMSLIDGGLFGHPAARGYWVSRLDTVWELFCNQIRAAKSPVERIRIFAESSLSKDFGCELTQKRLIQFLESKPSTDKLLASTALRHHMRACEVTTMLRFGAWLVADWVDAHWDDAVRVGDQERIFLQILLPKFESETSSFSCPVGACIEQMAKVTDCPDGKASASHLGQLWADFEFDQNIAQGSQNTVQSKQRLIRLWLDGNKGRPDAKSVFSLSKAVVYSVSGEADFDHSDQNPTTFFLGCGLIFSESCRYLLKKLIKEHFTAEEIVAIFSTYEDEYRKARSSFGKPLSANENTIPVES